MARKCVVKRAGHLENYDVRKVYGSVYSACASCGRSEKVCEKTADKVCGQVSQWVKAGRCVSSNGIFRKVVSVLSKLDKDAAFMYETHRDLS
ncbi:hypothetical protein HY546_01325 [archaeon]|nr:hypothetical protein [archaeon]